MDFLLIALRNVLSGSVSTTLALDFNCLSVRQSGNVLTDLLLMKFSYNYVVLVVRRRQASCCTSGATAGGLDNFVVGCYGREHVVLECLSPSHAIPVPNIREIDVILLRRHMSCSDDSATIDSCEQSAN